MTMLCLGMMEDWMPDVLVRRSAATVCKPKAGSCGGICSEAQQASTSRPCGGGARLPDSP